MEVISTHWRSCAYVCRFFCSIFNKSPLLFDFITSWFHKCKRIITRKRKTKFIKASVWSVKITFLLLKYHRFIDYSNAFCFFLVVKRLMITKNSVVKIQNFVVNHETWPVKSNPVYLILLHKFTLILPVTHSSSHEGKKKLTKFVYISSIIQSYLKLAKHNFFRQIHVFLGCVEVSSKPS